MDATTKKTLIGLITITKQLAEQNQKTLELLLETSLGARLEEGGHTKQSLVGLLRRLDELTRQVDQA